MMPTARRIVHTRRIILELCHAAVPYLTSAFVTALGDE
jgi:hypothetical protein